MDGGFVCGRDAVRQYWNALFKTVQPQLEPLKYETDEEGRNAITVRQIVKDLQGETLAEMTVQQIFTIENDLVSHSYSYKNKRFASDNGVLFPPKFSTKKKLKTVMLFI